MYKKALDYLDADNTLPLSAFFSRDKDCYVFSCDDELERVDIRVHIFRSEENCLSILQYYRSLGIDMDLLADL